MQKILNITLVLVAFALVVLVVAIQNNTIDFCASVYGADWHGQGGRCHNGIDDTTKPLPELTR